MKRIIIALSITGFISLGFTVVENNTLDRELSAKTGQNINSEKLNESKNINDKRLANWD